MDLSRNGTAKKRGHISITSITTKSVDLWKMNFSNKVSAMLLD